MDWHAPDANAWQRASERQVPLVFLFEADWCPYSQKFREQILNDVALAGFLSERFVCVRVDQREYPELDRRFGGGSWPTLALVGPDEALLDRIGPLPPGELLAKLHGWCEPAPGGPVDKTAEAESTFAQTSEAVMQRLLESADPKFGGWGQRQKFPHPEALHFALVRWSREGDSQTLTLVQNTLQHMQEGAIHDRVEGGFFRYARTQDWSDPHFQKLLDSNAQRMLAYAEAYQALGTASYRETALGIQAWMSDVLFDPKTGAFRASQDEDPEYYHLKSREARERRSAPPTDPWIYTDRNCDAICALLKAGVAFGMEEFIEQALGALDFLLDKLWHKTGGASHYWDGKPNLTGLLMDQAALLRAMTWATHYGGTLRYLEPALKLANHTLDAYGKVPTDGSLVDRLHDPKVRGSLEERQENLQANARFAEALMRLSYMAGLPQLRVLARRILTAFENDWPKFGNAIADYGRAVDLLAHEPIQVTIVGSANADRTRNLLRSALKPYIASRVVQTVDPVTDADWLERMGWPEPQQDDMPVAYLSQGGQCYARTSNPDEVPALMIRLGVSD